MFNFGGVSFVKLVAFGYVEMFMVSSAWGWIFWFLAALKKNNSKFLWYMMGLAKTL